MPEEVNRILIDAGADWWFPPSRDAEAHLLSIGCRPERVCMVGNVMIDTLLEHLPAAEAMQMPHKLGLAPHDYGVVTVHRPANTGPDRFLASLVNSLAMDATSLPLVVPVHPRLRSRLEHVGLWEKLAMSSHICVAPPLGYLEFISLLRDARLAITD